jgi:hypothetical protein
MRVALLTCLLAGRAAASPCSRPSALAKLAVTAFPPGVRTHADGSVQPIESTRLACAPVHGRTPFDLLTFDTGDGLLVALLRDNTVVWRDGHVTDDSLRNAVESATAADLDGNGVDEILLVVTHYGHERSGGTWLSIVEPTDTADEEVSVLGDVALAYRNGTMPLNDGGSDCNASWALVRGPRRTRDIVTVGGCQGTGPNNFPVGRHTYALRDGAIVEIQ